MRAAFRKATASPFGADDEIGMLNLIDAASRQAIMDRADPTRVYDLSVDNFVGMPGWFGADDQPYQIWMTHTPRGEEVDDVMGVGNGGERARLLFRQLDLDVHPHRHPHRCAEPFRLQWPDLQRLLRRRASRQPRLAQVRRRQASADHRARHHAGRGGAARRRRAAAKLRHRRNGPARLPQAPGHQTASRRRRR